MSDSSSGFRLSWPTVVVIAALSLAGLFTIIAGRLESQYARAAACCLFGALVPQIIYLIALLEARLEAPPAMLRWIVIASIPATTGGVFLLVMSYDLRIAYVGGGVLIVCQLSFLRGSDHLQSAIRAQAVASWGRFKESCKWGEKPSEAKLPGSAGGSHIVTGTGWAIEDAPAPRLPTLLSKKARFVLATCLLLVPVSMIFLVERQMKRARPSHPTYEERLAQYQQAYQQTVDERRRLNNRNASLLDGESSPDIEREYAENERRIAEIDVWVRTQRARW